MILNITHTCLRAIRYFHFIVTRNWQAKINFCKIVNIPAAPVFLSCFFPLFVFKRSLSLQTENCTRFLACTLNFSLHFRLSNNVQYLQLVHVECCNPHKFWMLFMWRALKNICNSLRFYIFWTTFVRPLFRMSMPDSVIKVKGYSDNY